MKKIVSIFDTETTGLMKAKDAPLSLQPYITEIYCAKFEVDFENKKMKFKGDFESFVRPPIPIEPLITKITGIDDKMLDDAEAKPFALIWHDLSKFYTGVDVNIAHNLRFDENVLETELRRIDKVTSFPWPRIKFCTVDKTTHFKGKRIKLGILHEMATGREHKEGAHRAKADVAALSRCFKWLLEEDYAKI